MWRRLFAAVVGVAVVAGASAAQSPPPRPLPPIVPVAAPVALPATSPGYAIPQVMPASGGTNGPASIRTDGLHGVIQQAPISYGVSGQGCANGCGNYKHDLGFMFGSCKSFFDPCGPQPCGGGFGTGRFRGGHKCGGGLCGGGRCPDHPFGTPYGTGHNGCKYDSWLNH
jgi:hypothetical protein